MSFMPQLWTIFLLLLSNLPIFHTSSAHIQAQPRSSIPTQVLAGVTLPNTPIVRSAQAYARAHADDMTYNHIMRSWLFGAIIVNRSPAHKTIDPEAHAVAALLHDLGWDNTGELVSPDRRFEVDGAVEAWAFIEKEVANGTVDGEVWDEARKWLVWDTIALHTSPQFFVYKQPLVFLTAAGINADFHGPDSDASGLLTWSDYYKVKKAFPRLDLAGGVTRIMCGFARDKPATTYDNFMMQFGIRYIANFSQAANGHLGIDEIESALPD